MKSWSERTTQRKAAVKIINGCHVPAPRVQQNQRWCHWPFLIIKPLTTMSLPQQGKQPPEKCLCGLHARQQSEKWTYSDWVHHDSVPVSLSHFKQQLLAKHGTLQQFLHSLELGPCNIFLCSVFIFKSFERTPVQFRLLRALNEICQGQCWPSWKKCKQNVSNGGTSIAPMQLPGGPTLKVNTNYSLTVLVSIQTAVKYLSWTYVYIQ